MIGYGYEHLGKASARLESLRRPPGVLEKIGHYRIATASGNPYDWGPPPGWRTASPRSRCRRRSQ